ncbi:spore germination protein [Effusibacillus consociatus]|uniref:Spore germination protein n=1 Tax=Effusibacillus consociatus TaxID=1117041 RepID=A0ABV9Q7V8_9BACL
MLVRKWFRKPKQFGSEQPHTAQQDPLSADFNENLQILRSIYEDCSDVVFRPFLIGGNQKAALVYIGGLSNLEEMDRSVLTPLMESSAADLNSLSAIFEKKVSAPKVKEVKTFADCIGQISIGNPVLLIEQENRGLSLGLSKWEKRAIEEPSAEPVLRGPRDGFTETLDVNTSLIRRRIRSPQLKMLSMKVGRYTQTRVVIAYIEGIADKTLLEEVKNRLQRIDMDGVLETGYIEEMIEDNPLSPFPQVLNTERPDIAVSNLLEGRVVILLDGTPFALVVPITLYSLLQAADDSYQRFTIGTAIRWLRYFFLTLSLLLPSIYVAVITYHHEMVPTTLLISMARSREEIPFPALIEALIMEITFEALREAGVRLPKQVGAAVSIVGTLVIGQAAVSAGIISAPMVMVVALTGIASFTIPRYAVGISLRLLRFPMISLAGTLGLLGIMLGIITIVVHLCTLRSFGVPYLTPMAPMKGREMKDVLMRAPWWMLNTRPHLTGEGNKYRQAPDQKPGPFRGDEQ